MNSAHRIETAELSDADLDHVSGGLHADVAAGPVAVSGSDVLAHLDAAKNQVMSTAAQYGHAGVHFSV